MPIYSLSAAAGAAAGGASGTGGATGARAAFGADGFFAAGAAACAEAAAGARGAGEAPAFAAGAAWRVGGSGFMMLIGGVDEALGNSALVGLPVGIDGGSPASAAVAGNCDVAGAFQVGA
jgi:hypothetical protein